MRLNPDKFEKLKYDGEAPYVQRTMARLDGAYVRIHRIGAPPPGLNRINTDNVGDDRMTFVLVHGIGLSSTYMLPLAEELSKLGEVMLLDLPGFGDVPPPDHELTIAGFATIIDRALKLHGINDPVLVGHSMGAQIVVELMARAPQRYKRAALVGPPVNHEERTIAKAALRYMESAIYERPNLVRVALWSYLRSVQRWVLEILPSMLNYPIEERIYGTAEDSRMVIIYGEHDYLVPSRWANYLAQRAGRARAYMVTEAAHSTIYNGDNEVAKLIRTLLTDRERAGAGKRHW